MKSKRKFRVLVVALISIAIFILIRLNVTATKEFDKNEKNAILALEVNSEIVSEVLSKLSLLDDKIGSDVYKNLYFKFGGEEKTLSIEDKMYIVFESLYKKGTLEEEILEDGEILYKTTPDVLKDEAASLFKDEDFDFLEANFVPSKNCGIVDYLYTGQQFEFKINNCDRTNDITKSKVVKAVKDGNLIELRIKAFRAFIDKKDKNKYEIRNFNADNVLNRVTLDEFKNKDEELFQNPLIEEYVFSFELRGDEYYLTKIKRNI